MKLFINDTMTYRYEEGEGKGEEKITQEHLDNIKEWLEPLKKYSCWYKTTLTLELVEVQILQQKCCLVEEDMADVLAILENFFNITYHFESRWHGAQYEEKYEFVLTIVGFKSLGT